MREAVTIDPASMLQIAEPAAARKMGAKFSVTTISGMYLHTCQPKAARVAESSNRIKSWLHAPKVWSHSLKCSHDLVDLQHKTMHNLRESQEEFYLRQSVTVLRQV
jgi:hypothetical protein